MKATIHALNTDRPTGLPSRQEIRIDRVMGEVKQFVLKERQDSEKSFGDFEQELHAKMMGMEREILAEKLEAADINVPAISINGRAYRQVLRSEDTYFTAAGAVRVMRSLYKESGANQSKSVCPLDLRVGLIEGRWTPLAARQAVWVVAQMTPQLGEELFQRMGNMKPSKSSLDRLPKQVNARWEKRREEFEQAIRIEECVPDEAMSCAISLDGVMIPTNASKVKQSEAGKGLQESKQVSIYREASCGTMSFYDEDGELLRAVRVGRMPESKKVTLKAMLKSELGHALAANPNLQVVGIADGAKDNWTYLEEDVLDVLPAGFKCSAIVDYFHVCEHLSEALKAAYGDTSPKAKIMLDKYKSTLKEFPDGARRVIRALAHLHKTYPKRKKIEETLNYFRSNKHRMPYATHLERKLPIGSGVIEATCKSLVSQRMKNSGMRWGQEGGQAIITQRAWAQSNRFDQAWALLASTYKATVLTIANVIQLHPKA